MRRRIRCFAAAAVLIGGLMVPARATEDLAAGCTAGVLMERETGQVLYAKAEHQRLSPASVTKVMTLLLVAEAVDSGALRPEELITASARAASMGGSQIWLREGEQLTVEEMTKCVAVVSANDCAVALAEHLCGTEAEFTRRMNDRAAELGLTDTHFTNCTGLFEDPEHYTSALDIAVMARELLGHEFVRQFTAIWTDTIRDGAFGLTNTNKLVRYYPGCTGLKTGFTSTAMFCLAASAARDGTEYIAVVLHGDTSQHRFDAARSLLDYGFANYALWRPAESEPTRLPVDMGQEDTVELVPAEPLSLLTEKRRLGDITLRAETPASVPAPVAEGQELGAVIVSDGETELRRIPLLAARAVERRSLGRVWLDLIRTLAGK